MFAQLKLYAAYFVGGVILILSLACGGEYLWIKHQAAELKTLNIELASAQDANLSSQATITSLLAERDKAGQTCQSRLSAKDDLIHRLQDIDALPSNSTPNTQNPTLISGGPHDAKNQGNNQTVVADRHSGNPLLDALNGMYPAPGGQAGVCQATGAADPSGASVLSGQVLYCFCSEQDVKDLLKNRELDKSDSKDLRTILDGLR
jgi:hypothetical protein